jgi:DNA-binding MarR family transcriptional regulator
MTVDSSLPPDVELTAGLFMEAMHAMMSHSAGTDIEVMNESGLTIPQIVTLHVLKCSGPKSVGDIAGCVKLSNAATSHLIERLVRMGMVHREEDAEDRRQKKVTVSPTGDALLGRLMAARRESLCSALRLLRPATRKALGKAMQAVVSDIAAVGVTSMAGGDR